MQLALHLVYEFVYCIPVKEASLSSPMGVEVAIEEQPSFLVQFVSNLSHPEATRLQQWVWR